MTKNTLKIDTNARGQPMHIKYNNGVNEWFDYADDGKIIKYVSSRAFDKYRRKKGYYEYVNGKLIWISLIAIAIIDKFKEQEKR